MSHEPLTRVRSGLMSGRSAVVLLLVLLSDLSLPVVSISLGGKGLHVTTSRLWASCLGLFTLTSVSGLRYSAQTQ